MPQGEGTQGSWAVDSAAFVKGWQNPHGNHSALVDLMQAFVPHAEGVIGSRRPCAYLYRYPENIPIPTE